MDESSLSGFTTENSMSMSIKEPSINTCTSFEKYLPICLTKD